MKKAILLLGIIIITSCINEEEQMDGIGERAYRIAEQAYKAGYQQGAINVLEHGTYNKNQWIVDSVQMNKLLSE